MSRTSINTLGKNITGRKNINDSLNNLKELAKKADAEDKQGAFTATAEILILSFCVTCFTYAFTLFIFPNNLVNYYRALNAQLSERYKYKENNNEKKSDLLKKIINHLLDNWHYYLGGFFTTGGVYAYKKWKSKKKRKAVQQRQMEEAIQEEMDRLKEALENEIKDTTSAGGVVNNKPSILSGNIVELFNTFASIMGIQNNLPREKEDTALEYFTKVCESINFPLTEGQKACKYFDDELYGKKNSTQEDRAAFMQLLLEMLNKVKPKSIKKAIDLNKANA